MAHDPNLLAKRILIVMYELSNGQAGKAVHINDLVTRANEIGLMEMSEAEFSSYHHNVILAAKAKREGSIQ